MSFPTLTVTNVGKGMLLAAMGGTGITFTRVKIGSGDAPADVRELTDLVNVVDTAPISDYQQEEGSVRVEFVFTNEAVETAFSWKEVGLFAQPEDGAEGLFAYANAGDDAETVPANSGAFYEENTYQLVIIVDSSDNLSANVRSMTYATRAEFEAHLQDKDNPHGLTKAKLGLGSVPNVSTNNQLPTFQEADVLTELVSGRDKMSALMGKLAKGISSLIAHLNDTSNPHKLKPSGIGAAAEKHNHKASEITEGTLSTTRGGTGRSQWTEGRLLYAQDEETLGQLEPPEGTSALLQDATGAPYFATISQLADLLTDALQSSIQTVMEANRPKIGTYTGTGADNTLISVGFRPSAAIVTRGDFGGEYLADWSSWQQAAVCKPGAWPATGFLVNQSMNRRGQTYAYIAFH